MEIDIDITYHCRAVNIMRVCCWAVSNGWLLCHPAGSTPGRLCYNTPHTTHPVDLYAPPTPIVAGGHLYMQITAPIGHTHTHPVDLYAPPMQIITGGHLYVYIYIAIFCV